jgi:hypothetical protein
MQQRPEASSRSARETISRCKWLSMVSATQMGHRLLERFHLGSQLAAGQTCGIA